VAHHQDYGSNSISDSFLEILKECIHEHEALEKPKAVRNVAIIESGSRICCIAPGTFNIMIWISTVVFF